MKLNQILTAYLAYLSGKGSFRIGARTVSLANTGTGPVKFTFATALAAIEAEALFAASTRSVVYPISMTIGSTSITVS